MSARAAFVAYHDLGGVPSPGNITTQPDLATTMDLIQFSDGADTGADFSVAGANSIATTPGAGLPPASGTPAGNLFLASGIDLDDGLIVEGGNSGSGATTFTLGGLDPTQLYDVAIYGDRNTSADGVERFTLGGADAAVNTSSAYKISNAATDMETRPNSAAGNVARWSDIRPGADGTITIDIDPEVTSPSNIAYLSALRLEETGAAPPLPPLSAITAFHDLGGEPSPGNITTQQSLATTHTLIDLSTGADTGIQFSIAGANGIDVRTGTVTRPPASGTPAGDLFLASGIDLDDGIVNEGGNNGADPTTFTFSGLDPNRLYDIALYGDRNLGADGVERFTLGGADAAVNSSSIGIAGTFITDMETRPNATAGNVVRWTDINPGADGIITIDMDPEVTSPSNVAYLSAVRIASAAPAGADEVPEPATMAMLGLAVAGLGGYVRRRKRS